LKKNAKTPTFYLACGYQSAHRCNFDASRRGLSFALCEAWNWKQDNGAPCDAVCRGLLLQLHRAGHVELPVARWASRRARRHEVLESIAIEAQPLQAKLSQLQTLRIDQVRRTPDEALVKSLVAQYHYLGYVATVTATCRARVDDWVV
jgi:hypothetical protein